MGVDEDAITSAILSNGAFLIKGGEMQQIINHSIINYKAFFRWLYTAIVHVLEEQVPNEIPQMTQQDLAYIAEFLQNFDHIGKNSNQKGFIMERLGQYLLDAPLTIKPDMTGNEWSAFIKQNQCLTKNDSILRHFEEMSLIQQYKHLNDGVGEIFVKPKEAIGRQFALQATFDCFQYGGGAFKVTQVNLSKDAIVFAFLQPPERVLLTQLYLVEGSCFVKCARMHFTQDNSSDDFHVLDIQLYSSTVLSVLLQDSVAKATMLSQVALSRALEKFSEVGEAGGAVFGNVVDINGSVLAPRLFKSVEGMAGAEFAVSGSRKVGILLAENRRKVRLYEMEGEEEEDEDAEMTNSTIRDGELSIQEMNVTVN